MLQKLTGVLFFFGYWQLCSESEANHQNFT